MAPSTRSSKGKTSSGPEQTSPSTEITINWLFFNKTANPGSVVHPFSIAGHPSTSLGSLNWIDALETWFRFQADESTLKFYIPSAPLNGDDVEEDWLEKHPEIRRVAKRCQPIKPINKIIGDPDQVHVLVMADGSEEDAGQMSAEEAWDSLSGSPIVRMHAYLRAARTPMLRPPSSAAPSREYMKLQGGIKTAICDGYFKPGRPVDTTALPVQIFHPVFRQFLDRVNDPTFGPDENTITTVSQLMAATMEINPKETNAFDALRPLLTALLGKNVGQRSSVGTRTPDGLVYKKIRDFIVPLLCVEYKRSVGEGGCDPSVQAAYSVKEFLLLNEFKPMFEKCCCPCFLLSGSGSYMTILGAVFPYKFAVQRLTDAQWVGEATPHEDGRTYNLARVFYALRLGLAALDEYYDQVWKDKRIPKLVLNKPHPRFFPYPTGFIEHHPSSEGQKWIDFDYFDLPRMDPTNVTFMARAKSSGRKLVIKFVERYGVEPHDVLANEGMAPQLLYCGLLDGKTDVRNAKSDIRVRGSIKTGGLYVGPIRMVVMEYIKGTTLDKTPDPPEDTREQIQKAVEILHKRQLVFGDLRAPNVLISGAKVYLIDFDWSGGVNEARYPLHLSKRVTWPENTEDLELKPILAEHDSFMLDELFPPPAEQ